MTGEKIFGCELLFLKIKSLILCRLQVNLQKSGFWYLNFYTFTIAKMTTRKTTTGYKVTIDIDEWQEKFDFYEDVKVCFKNCCRGYDLDKITSDFSLDELEIDFLLWKITKKELKEERYRHDEEYFKELEDYKKNYQVVWLSIGEHSQFSIWYGDDGIMLVDNDASNEFIQELVKELENWFNGWIYCIGIYEPEKFTSDENWRKLTVWNYIDGQGWFFEPEEALNSLPDYAGEIIKDTETERFEEFERC